MPQPTAAGRRREGRPGQTLIIFAVGSTVILMFVSLALDAGMAMLLRRQLQSAADAGARAATLIMRQTGATDAAVQTELYNIAVANGYTGATTGIGSYVDSASPANVLAAIGGGVIPTTATGLRAELTQTRPTVLTALLGQQSAITVTAIASFRQGNLATIAGQGDSPFILCGAPAQPTSGPAVNIITTSAPFVIDSTKVGTTFTIHDPALGLGSGDCGMGTSWKGLAPDNEASTCSELPCAWTTSNGVIAGPARTRVAGQTGCTASSASTIDNCLMVVPIAVPSSIAGGCGTVTSGDLCTVTWGLFRINQISANKHTATLLDGSKYVVLSGSGGSSAPPSSCTACPQVLGGSE